MALPTNFFNADWYLTHNPDVARAIEQGLIGSAEEHFNNFGKYEERAASPLFNTQDYLAANPDVADAIAAGLTTAYDHFVQYGAAEGRSPLSLFDPDFYLTQNPDVAAAVEAGLMSATEHFLLYGQSEPRAINPLINLGAYMNANPDLAGAAAQGVISPMAHLLSYGAAEGRDLGNGVNLGIFANDPAFQSAVAGGNLQAALERAGDVAPFLPTFQSPPGWAAPANTPIPMDFTPPAGTTLVIPPTVVVPPDTELPPSFEPVIPPAPTPPAPTPGGGAGGATPTFRVKETDDVVTFSGSAKGEISIEFAAGEDPASATATFTRGNVAATHAVEDFDAKTLSFVNESVTIAGAGDKVGTLNLKLDTAHVTLPDNKEKNLLVDADSDTPKSLKKLNIEASGASSVDLGNHALGDAGVGYFLGAVTVEGGAADSENTLEIGTLYFGSENTNFNSTGYSGDVHLDAYVYHGSPAYEKWEIVFGKGDDVLHLLNDPGTVWDVPAADNIIDGGAGDDTLIMELNGTFKVPSTAKFTSFEHIVLNHSGAMSEQINAGVFEGAEQIEQVGNIAGSISNLAEGQKAAFTNTSNSGHTQTIGVSYGDGVNNAALVLNNIASDTHFAIHGANVTNLTIEGSIESGGGIEGQLTFSALPNNLDSITLNMVSTTNIGLYTLNAITPFRNATKIDGSLSTGDLVLEMEALPTSALSSISTGSGDDLIRLSVDSLNGEDLCISTGEGNDELILTGPSNTGGKNIILASEGVLTVDASSLKQVNDDTKIVVSDLGETMTIKVADLDLGDSGNKSDLGDGTPDGGRKSNQEIHLNGGDSSLHDGTLVIENMTISSTSGYTHDPVQNDTIHFSGMASNVEGFAALVTSFTVSKGAPLSGDLHYVTFEMEFDLDEEDGADFTLVLENIVSANVYNNMLRTLDTPEGSETTLDEYQFSGGEPVTLGEPAISGLIGILITERTFVFDSIG